MFFTVQISETKIHSLDAAMCEKSFELTFDSLLDMMFMDRQYSYYFKFYTKKSSPVLQFLDYRHVSLSQCAILWAVGL